MLYNMNTCTYISYIMILAKVYNYTLYHHTVQVATLACVFLVINHLNDFVLVGTEKHHYIK